MVKPQFEVGRDRLGHGGVVRSPELRAEVTLNVAREALKNGLSTKAVTASPLPGPSGNVEYFLWLVKDGGESAPGDEELLTMVETAIEEGPQ
jgi:23S rRNA (cytidine1920-2'-O)/16S rRNA (cytidine1409-2'-O)-methyltransferase